MNAQPKNTWELANELESFAKMLKRIPKFYFGVESVEDKKYDIKSKLQKIEDYSNLTVTQLKKECKIRGLKGYSKKKKTELIKLLNDFDTGTTTLKKISTAFQHIGE